MKSNADAHLTELISFRVTKVERDQIEAKARADDRKVADWVRRTVRIAALMTAVKRAK